MIYWFKYGGYYIIDYDKIFSFGGLCFGNCFLDGGGCDVVVFWVCCYGKVVYVK